MPNKTSINKLSDISNQELYALCKLNQYLIDLYTNEVEANKMSGFFEYEETKSLLNEQVLFKKLIVDETGKRIKNLIK